MLRNLGYEHFNQGIGLDIFPIDNCKPEFANANWEKINELVLWNSTNMRRSHQSPSQKDLERMDKYPLRDGKEILRELNSIATHYNYQKTEFGIVSTITAYRAERQIYKWKDILDIIDYNFYGYQIKIPRNYNNILRTTYGDYMQLPPIEERGTWHSSTIFEPDIPYKHYLKTLHLI